MSLYDKLKFAVAGNSDSMRHAFVTHALQNGNDIATVKELVGHEDVNTTMIYAHGDAARGVSPLDGVVRIAPAEVNFLA